MSFPDSIRRMFVHHGHAPVAVRDRSGKGAPGYVASFASRAEAISAGRLVLEGFACDPESGSPSIAVLVRGDGSALLCVGSER